MATTEREFYDKVVEPLNKNEKQEEKGLIFKALLDELLRIGEMERELQLAEIQRCLKYWHGEAATFWDESARSWGTVWDAYRQGLADEDDLRAYNKDINFYRPLLESIIAASTIEVVRLYFVPSRPSDPLDIITSREATKVSTYLDQQNDAKQLLEQAQFILANQHFVAGYVYYEEDGEKYGTDLEEVKGMIDKTRDIEMCPECAGDLMNEPPADMGMGLDQPYLKQCASCGQLVEPQPDQETYQEEGIVGYNEIPKGKVCIEVYGPQEVRLPYYVKNLKASPYLLLEQEENVGILADIYQDKAEEILGIRTSQGDKYGRWARASVVTGGESVSDRATRRRLWIHPWAFNFIPKTQRQAIREEYKKGALVHFVDEIFIKCEPANMDEQWSLTEPSFSETIHDDPSGKIVIPTCEMQNDLLQLLMENLKHNIPELFVDSQLLDMKKYAEQMAKPGARVPVKRPPGLTISSGIHETRAVTLPQESLSLYSVLEQVSQFVSKAMPSIFGGYLQKGSNTAFEYDASRQAALQRVALNLSMVNAWWARLKLQAVKIYAANSQKMEEYAARSGGSYKSVTINPENLRGNIDRAMPESSSNFPTTWSQKRDFFIQALQSNNQQLVQLLFHPENSTLLKELIGIPELFVPGEQDRMKQLFEISELLKSGPEQVPVMSMMGPQMVEQSSIVPDPRTDNGPAHIITLQNWLNSDDGREEQKRNPEGYANVIAHLTEHIKLMQEAPFPEAEGPGEVEPPTPEAPQMTEGAPYAG